VLLGALSAVGQAFTGSAAKREQGVFTIGMPVDHGATIGGDPGRMP